MQTKKKSLLKLLDRYLKNRATDDEKQALDVWYATIQREEEKGPDALSDDALKSQMWQDIRSGMYGEKEVVPMAEERTWWQIRHYQVAAATVLLLLSFAFYRSFVYRKTLISGIPESEIAHMIKEENATSSPRPIRLSDGSQITLEPGAALFYPKGFDGDRRVVYFKGNGFFEIAKNPDKPFLVYTDDILTKVLGTSFKIEKDQEKGLVEVSVTTGKVMVGKVTHDDTGKSPADNGVVLTPNKRVIYYTESEKYVVSLVEKPQIIEKESAYQKPETFIFKGTPLSVILSKLEKAYGVQISVNDEKMKACTVTADLSQDDLYGKLEVICAAVSASFELEQDKINLTGQGCDAHE